MHLLSIIQRIVVQVSRVHDCHRSTVVNVLYLSLYLGYYLWMTRRQSIQGRKARIESELLAIDVVCVSFWYYMNNTIDAQLNIYTRDPRSDFYNKIWSIDKSHGTYWLQKEVTIRPNMTVNGTNRFTIVYEAVVGSQIGGM
jgi:hypothetical protein